MSTSVLKRRSMPLPKWHPISSTRLTTPGPLTAGPRHGADATPAGEAAVPCGTSDRGTPTRDVMTSGAHNPLIGIVLARLSSSSIAIQLAPFHSVPNARPTRPC
jgi:hypothetical protein